jgi:hypothetical protein
MSGEMQRRTEVAEEADAAQNSPESLPLTYNQPGHVCRTPAASR